MQPPSGGRPKGFAGEDPAGVLAGPHRSPLGRLGLPGSCLGIRWVGGTS